MSSNRAATLICRASGSTVGSLFGARARLTPAALAVDDGRRRLTYAELDERVNRTAQALSGLGIARGERAAILSENRIEYLELELACAKLGAIAACQNWRLAPPELQHCISLVEPRVVIVSPRHAALLGKVDTGAAGVIELGPTWEERLGRSDVAAPPEAAEPEDGLLILYTSGTTGLPKGAVLSHRAEIARALVFRHHLGGGVSSNYVAWPPFFHMAATEPSFAALLEGSTVFVVDGFDAGRIAELAGQHELGWLVLMPGMVGAMAAELTRRQTRPRGVALCGAMADLVPAHEIAEVTRLLGCPYANTFGSTETGLPPASAGRLAVGEVPLRLGKTQSPYCEIRLVDPADSDVADGDPGELALRGPTLFSGYWRADETNARDFRGGWFHMGDMFRRNPDGTLDFVDRVKYMIKSGGENIYPAEIERVLLADARVADAVVVRQRDQRWGEVPVAFVARRDTSLTVDELLRLCRDSLAGYKQPKQIHFVRVEDLPRSTTGKIQRHEIEGWLERGEIPSD
jgi:acyl-CoA synthetase (AMP-forming)/AMP-acid ligase II